MINEIKKEILEDTKIAKKVFSDGCTGVPEFMMHDFCVDHDADYKKGSGVSKWRADWKLLYKGWKKANTYEKMYQRAGARIIATGFYMGVSIFGWFFYNKV